MDKKKQEFEKTVFDYIRLRHQKKVYQSEYLDLAKEELRYKLLLIWDEPTLTDIETNFVTKTKKIPKLTEYTYVKKPELKLPDVSFLRKRAISDFRFDRDHRKKETYRIYKSQEGHRQRYLEEEIELLQDKLTSKELANEFYTESFETLSIELYNLSESGILERKKKIEKQKVSLISDTEHHEQIIKALYQLQKDLKDKPIDELYSKIKKLRDEKAYRLIYSSEFDADKNSVKNFINTNFHQQVAIVQDLKYALEELKTRDPALNKKKEESDIRYRKKVEIRVKELKEKIGSHEMHLQEIQQKLNAKKSELSDLIANFEKDPEVIKVRKILKKQRKKIDEEYKKNLDMIENTSDEELLAPYKRMNEYKEKTVRKALTEFSFKQYKQDEWITKNLRERKQQWDKIISQRASIIDEKGINRLLHFTTIENLMSILKHGSIFSIDYLKEENIYHSVSDTNRFDNKTDYISLSISFPNYRMFHQKKRGSNNDWVVLEINPKILLNHLSLFYQKNAANSEMRDKLFPYSNVEFRKMFIDSDNHRKKNELEENETTDPQAEILVKRKINVRYIYRVLFENEKIKMKYNNQLKDKIKTSTNESLFSSRKDWRAWTNY